jgi:cyclase
MEIRELKPGVFACLTANETSNAGFIVTQRGVLVVDTLNTPALGRDLAAAIQGRTDKPVLFVINTHHHSDHVFGNQAFDAPVIAHCALAGQLAQAAARNLMPLSIAAWVSEHPKDRWLAEELELVYPQIVFDRRLVLDFPPAPVVVQHLGGHTPESCIVDLPDQGILFAADLVFEGRTPFLRDAHIGETIRALAAIQSLGPRTIVPGHGELCDMGYVARLQEYFQSLCDAVQGLIAEGLEKTAVLDSDRLPRWWTEDRPDLARANIIRVYNELTSE